MPLASLHGLAALNIYFDGNQQASQIAFSKFFKNLTYQALSQENDNIFLSFDDGIYLVNSILEAFVNKRKRKLKKHLKLVKK